MKTRTKPHSQRLVSEGTFSSPSLNLENWTYDGTSTQPHTATPYCAPPWQMALGFPKVIRAIYEHYPLKLALRGWQMYGSKRYLLTLSRRFGGSPVMCASFGSGIHRVMTALPKATCTMPTARGCDKYGRNLRNRYWQYTRRSVNAMFLYQQMTGEANQSQIPCAGGFPSSVFMWLCLFLLRHKFKSISFPVSANNICNTQTERLFRGGYEIWKIL